jgi:hypothetical protein
MESRINKKIQSWTSNFKEKIKEELSNTTLEQEQTNKLIQFVYNYEAFCLTKEDFIKRKRTKNNIHHFERCVAKKSNDEQCTRKKKEGKDYCGTHLKGLPHGVMDSQNATESNKKVEVWAQDIQGILYYIDDKSNVYQAEDILSNKLNPKIIAKYKKENETYSIPSFNY